MRSSLGELHPSRAVARRMHELETELQQARMHLRRHSKSPNTTGRWGLEQPAPAQQEEGWFITYLDMMTLLLVVMIVMLAFSGAIGSRTGDDTSDERAVTTTTRAADREPDQVPAPVTAAEEQSATEPADIAQPSTEPAPEVAQATPAGGEGLLPAGAGLFPGDGSMPDTAMLSESYPGWTPGAPVTGPPAHPADVGPLPRPTAAGLDAGGDSQLLPAPAHPKTESLYPGWSAADLAASFIGPPRPTDLPGADPTETAISPSAPSPAPEEDPLSEGELLAADLALGELGSDIEVVISERSVSFRVNSEILFDSSQSDLSRTGLAVLRKIVNVLTQRGYDITVEGHTDSVPVRRNVRFPSNWELSSARAGSVVRYLQANGIDRARLKAVGYADTRPIADNHTPEGRARNRRVELVIEKRE